MNLTSRVYQHPADLAAATRLTAELRAQGQMVYPNAADLYEELADPRVQATARLWYDKTDLAGFAYVSRYQNLVDVFSVTAFTPAAQSELIAWLESAARQRYQASGEAMTLDASALEDDLPRLAFLERFGFRRQDESSLRMSRSLAGPLPERRLSPGYVIRPMLGAAELEAYVSLHRAAFDTDNMDLDYRQAIMDAPGYLPELDLVAVAPDGELAAFCMCQIFMGDSEKEGWTDPVGTHPAHRRRGLAAALISAGMGLLRERGVETALLGTSSVNIAMQRLAEELGFRKVANTLWFSKSI